MLLKCTCTYKCIRIETGVGHPGYLGLPGHVLSGSSRSVYPGICIRSCALIMASVTDQSDELSMLDGDYGSISSDSPQDVWSADCTIRSFRLFGAWIMHSPTPQKYVATITTSYHFI